MNRQDLKDYKFLKARIDEKLNDYEEQFARVTRMTQTIDGMPKAHNKPNYTVEELIDSSNELIALLNKDVIKQKEIISQLDSMENEKYHTVLYMRYIENKPLEEVASKIGYDYYETCKINGKALNEFDKLDEIKMHKKTQDNTTFL